MHQTGTRRKAAARAKIGRASMTLKQAAIVLGVTSVLSVVIGLLPHFH